MNGPDMSYLDVNRMDNLHDMPAEYGISTPSIGGSHQYDDSYPPPSNDFMSDEQTNLFDFEPPPPASPFREQLSSPDHTDPFSSWNSSNPPLLSPPSSGLFPSPQNHRFFMRPQAPPNILTSIDPARTRAQYGQVTPPDDKNSVRFSPLHGQLQPVITAMSAGVKKRKRLSATRTQTSKRTRKNAPLSLSLDAQDLDPNSPEQMRRMKFLERNRVAASKCRQKKKQWIDKTEAQARELQSHNQSLHLLLESLQNEILYVKAQMVKHMDCEASDIKTFIEQRPDSFADALRAYEPYERNRNLPSDHISLKQEDADAEYGKDSEDSLDIIQPSPPASHLDDSQSLKALLARELGQEATKEE